MWQARDEGRHRGQTSTVSVPPEPPVRHPTAHTQEAVQRWRLVVRREPLDADQIQRAQQGAWEAALRDSGLPVAGLDGDGGRPRFALAAPLAPAILGEAELADVWLTAREPRWAVREALTTAMPDGQRADRCLRRLARRGGPAGARRRVGVSGDDRRRRCGGLGAGPGGCRDGSAGRDDPPAGTPARRPDRALRPAAVHRRVSACGHAARPPRSSWSCATIPRRASGGPRRCSPSSPTGPASRSTVR